MDKKKFYMSYKIKTEPFYCFYNNANITHASKCFISYNRHKSKNRQYDKNFINPKKNCKDGFK